MSSVQEPGSARSARLEAERAFQALDLHRALQHYSTAIELEPADAEYVHLSQSARVHLHLRDERELAREKNEPAEALYYLVRRLRSMRAACYCMLGAWPAAVDDLEKAAELQPCAGAHARLAEARLQLGDYSGAFSALAAAKQADDAAECAELPALEAEAVQRSNALPPQSSEPQRPTVAQPNIEGEREPEPEGTWTPQPEPEPEPRHTPDLTLCQPCSASPAPPGKYRGSLRWAPGAAWPSPLRRASAGADVPLTDWASALATRMPLSVGALPSALPAQVIDGLSFPYSVAWALRKLSFIPVGFEFHICVLGASARVEQQLLHADNEQPGGYWVELLHLCRWTDDSGKTVLPSLVVHLVGPEVTVEDPQTVELADAGSLRVECHASDALPFIDAHPTLFQRSRLSGPLVSNSDERAEDSTGTAAGWGCLAIAYHSGFGTGDPALLHSWLPALRRLVMLGVPTVCTCPNMVVDGAGEVAVLTQALGARVIDLTASEDSLATVQAIINPFAGASLHVERDTSGLIDLSWRPNQFIYAFWGRVKDAGPMPELEDQRDMALAHKMGCSGLVCVANHALMFAKMRRVAEQLR